MQKGHANVFYTGWVLGVTDVGGKNQLQIECP